MLAELNPSILSVYWPIKLEHCQLLHSKSAISGSGKRKRSDNRTWKRIQEIDTTSEFLIQVNTHWTCPNFRKGTALGDLQDIVRKHQDESWRHHAEQRKISRNMARRRKVTNDQYFISGSFFVFYGIQNAEQFLHLVLCKKLVKEWFWSHLHWSQQNRTPETEKFVKSDWLMVLFV